LLTQGELVQPDENQKAASARPDTHNHAENRGRDRGALRINVLFTMSREFPVTYTLS
jgi:hypothetical protein